MKKSIKYLALAICPVFFAFSCAKNEAILEVGENEPSIDVADNSDSQLEKVMRTVIFEFPSDPETKVSLAADGKTGWEVGDEIFIHGQKVGQSGDVYYSRVVTLGAGDISADAKTATFTFEDFTVNTGSWDRTNYTATMFAAYPASAVSAFSNGTSWYYTTPFANSNELLLAGCNDIEVNDGNTFTLHNLCGAFSFVVEDEDIDGYIFEGNGGTEVVGYDVFSVRIDKDQYEDKIYIPWTSGSGVVTSGPSTSVSGPVTADGSTINYVYFPGGVNLANGFTIYFTNGGDIIKYIKTNTAKNIKRGKYLNVGNITAHLKTYEAPTGHNATAPAIAGATDLSASGSANCYVVDGSDDGNANKVFKFKAYKGNSSTNVGTISSVEIVWETWNNESTVTKNSVIAAVDYDKQDANDYYEICFQMPETLHTGNALIAAKNAGGTILWSWHIWVPNGTSTDVDASSICGATMMDRNLGALDKVDTGTGASVYTFGLMYQWGRKDPFPGPKRVEQWVNPATVSGTAPSLNNGSMTMADAIANPTVFGNVSGADWQTETDMTRWSISTKTVNDPCPPGYKIPYGVRGSKPMWDTSDIPAALTTAGLGWELNTAGYWFRMYDGDKEVVFPLCGYVDDSVSDHYQISNAIVRAGIWCLSDSSSSKYHLDIRTDKSTYKFTSTYAARACNIRCVAE